MKKWIALVLCTLGLLVLAAMCPPPPEKPVCDEGQITITPAQWVADQTHQECTKMGWVRHGFFDWRYECIKYKTVVDVPAHWTDPVCKEPDPEPIYGCMDPLALNYDKTATVDDKTCEYLPIEPPIIIPPKPECLEVQQPYGMAQLFGPGNQWGLMYIYPDPKTGELPEAVGVQRQLCVLGWVAEREGYFGFVYRNSCTGVYTWNGLNVSPRPDVLKHGVCARNGACIAQ